MDTSNIFDKLFTGFPSPTDFPDNYTSTCGPLESCVMYVHDPRGSPSDPASQAHILRWVTRIARKNRLPTVTGSVHAPLR